jgi:carbon monoxide dehydrogenase subunit G
MISVHESFEVPSDPDVVWRIVSNPDEIASCIPGAVLEERHEDGSFSGSIVVQFGPAKVKFNARVTFDADHAAKVGRVTGRGKDTAGGTRAEMAFSFSVRENGAGTTVAGDGEMNIKGRLASMIEAGASVVVKRMLAEFSHNLAARCGAPESRAPAPKKSLWQRFLHALGQFSRRRLGLPTHKHG